MRTESIAMRLNLLPVILAAALALTLLLAACGGDDPGDVGDSGGDVPTSSSREAGNPTPTPVTATAGATEAPIAGPTPCRPERDLAALIALYNATDGDNWALNDNWLSDAPLTEWVEVVTEEDGCVTALDLERHQLSGEIPAELGNLTSLRVLNLNGNKLSGEIPAELGNLTNLQSLYLDENQLSGEIPPELGNISDLEWLYLSRNQLSGEIPAELGNLANLERLYLDENQLSGEIPLWLGDLANLEDLFLYGNQLSGCVPAGPRDVPNNDLWELGLPDC